MQNDQLKIAVAQMTSLDDLNHNVSRIESFILKASQLPQKPEIIFFPENCLYMRVVEGDSLPAISFDESFWSRLKNLCQEQSLAIHLGSVPLKMRDGVFNASVFIDDKGAIHSNYQKMHLFDIQLEGQKPIRESDAFKSGTGPAVLNYKSWSMGQSICYDIRFAELYNFYAKQEVDLILVPAAFLVKTGEAHWHHLLRARAIESQCYVIASGQTGTHISLRQPGSERSTFGHSLVINPWGEILLDLGTEEQLGFLVLDRQEIQTVRRQIPMKSHRRGDYFKT